MRYHAQKKCHTDTLTSTGSTPKAIGAPPILWGGGGGGGGGERGRGTKHLGGGSDQKFFGQSQFWIFLYTLSAVSSQ